MKLFEFVIKHILFTYYPNAPSSILQILQAYHFLDQCHSVILKVTNKSTSMNHLQKKEKVYLIFRTNLEKYHKCVNDKFILTYCIVVPFIRIGL